MLPNSTIEIQNQILGVALDIPGTPFSLHYSSDRHSGRRAAYTLNIPLTNARISPQVKEVQLEVQVAGQKFIEKFPPQPNLKHTFNWDGKDSEGQICFGQQPASLRTSYIYQNGKPPKSKSSIMNLGTWSGLSLGLGGWSLDIHHSYDVTGDVLHLGNGKRRAKLGIKTNGLDAEIKIPNENGEQVYVFDKSGRHLRTVNSLTRGLLYQFAYDDRGFLASITDGDNNITPIERATDGTLLAIVSPYGQRFPLTLNTDGYLATIANSSAETATFTYENGGLLTSFSDPKGNVYRFEYDELGRLKSREEPDGNFSLLSRAPTKEGFQVARITASGRESSYVTERLSDGKERQINKCCGAGAIVALTDKKGNQTITYPDGSTLLEEKQGDPRFGQLVPLTKRRLFTTPGGKMAMVSSTRIVKLTDPQDPLTVEKIVDTVDFNGRVSTTTYDLLKGHVTYTSPGGRQRILSLDEKGRVTKSEIPGLEPVHFNYGKRGELLSVCQGDQTILSYSYDKFCRLNGMRNSEGNEINYVCDESGRILESSLSSGKVNKFSYDANGNLTEITVPSGAVHQLNYNATNLALGSTNPQRGNTNSEYNSEQKPINKLLPSGRAIKNIYDRDGDLQRVSYPEADISISYLPKAQGFELTRTPADSDTSQKIAFGFDALLAPQLGFVETTIARQNRQRESQKLLLNAMIPDTGLEKALSRQADGFLAQFGTFSYDRGLITEINYSGVAKGRYRYRYDNNFFLVGVKLDDRPETILQRDVDGLLVQLGDFQMERQGCYDLLTGIRDGCLQVSLEYDDIGRIVKRTHAVKGRVVYQLSLGYEGLYQIVQKQETVLGKTKTYDYTLDRDGQLIRVGEKGVVVESYSYDDNGNRISWQLGNANPQRAKYDSQDRILELGNVAYQFDDDGFMAQRGATAFEYSSRGELIKVMLPDGKVITYAYDGVGRRVARSSSAGTYEYLYGNPEKPFQVTAIREPSGVLSVCYYDDLGLLFAMQRGEDWFYVATDQLGTPIVVVDATGETVKVMEYDSFGNQVPDSNRGFVMPIGFAAGLVDWETKLVRFGFRDYDPASGRWCAKDPIGFAAGDSNLYRYVNLNPVGFVDRSGEQETSVNNYSSINQSLPQSTINGGTSNLVCSFPRVNTGNQSDAQLDQLANESGLPRENFVRDEDGKVFFVDDEGRIYLIPNQGTSYIGSVNLKVDTSEYNQNSNERELSPEELTAIEKERSQLNKELALEIAKVTADTTGILDPTPTSDLISAGISLEQGDWLGFGLSLISAIPYAGDAVGKPVKAVRSAKTIAKLRKRIKVLDNKLSPPKQKHLNQEQGRLGEDKIRNILQQHEQKGKIKILGDQKRIETEHGDRVTDFLIQKQSTGEIINIEVKTGGARRSPTQRLKDEWLLENRQIRTVVSKPKVETSQGTVKPVRAKKDLVGGPEDLGKSLPKNPD